MNNMTQDCVSHESRWTKHLAVLGINATNLLVSAAITKTAWSRSKSRVRPPTAPCYQITDLPNTNRSQQGLS
jgi:hypothetical protein